MTTSTTAPAAAAQPCAASSTADAPAEYVAAPHPLSAIVDRWFLETFHNRGLPVAEFNRLNLARESLKADLVAFAKES